ncbi:Glycerol-3-phosphate dehydrogenase [NAD(P)+] [Sulfidibacter corallicola]
MDSHQTADHRATVRRCAQRFYFIARQAEPAVGWLFCYTSGGHFESGNQQAQGAGPRGTIVMKFGVLGGGSWGTALAILWAKHGHHVDLWVRNPDHAAKFREAGANTRYLPDYPFPERLNVTDDLEHAVHDNDLLVIAVPLQAYRSFLGHIAPMLRPDHNLILTSKGVELNTSYLPQQIVDDVLGEDWGPRSFTLSGPSFAKEVAMDKPTVVVLAGMVDASLLKLQEELTTPTFRMYNNHDVLGVELCGALKNVIAIASGMVIGLDLGNNSMAGLITRGLTEISRLGAAMGAERETFAGLAGMGDLILTCTGSLSRNLRVGQSIARGNSLEKTLDDLGMVAEGVHTCRSARKLAKDHGVELPISEVVYRILYEGLTPPEGLRLLMTRSLKSELESRRQD